jgi:hypothetical protein
MISIFTIVSWAIVLLNLISVYIGIRVFARFQGKLKNAMVYLLLALLLLFMGGVFRVLEIIPPQKLETTNLFMNLFITILTLMGIVSLSKAIEVIDKRKK